MAAFIEPDLIRADFCRALSEMYRSEVPLYGDLVSLVDEINSSADNGADGDGDDDEWRSNPHRIKVERHGAIRVGKASELRMLARLFRLMGMMPVGYYDLSTSGIPVHATAFRPLSTSSLTRNPFRIFTSLLRLDLIADTSLRGTISRVLGAREIFHPELRRLVAKAEYQGGLDREDAGSLVQYALHTFRWHEESLVDEEMYDRMKACHPLVADIAAFKGPHINHLTPRVSDIDKAQAGMELRGITPKMLIEGPPRRQCPILLRQTSFKAISERIRFKGSDAVLGHRARFGEIESRGVALTPKGFRLYRASMDEAAQRSRETNPSNEAHQALLSEVFHSFPDDWETLRSEELAYFEYTLTSDPPAARGASLDDLVLSGAVQYSPITYEDFLPASAAGIFQSNLDSTTPSRDDHEGEGEGECGERTARTAFEQALGRSLLDYMEVYQAQQRASVDKVLGAL